MVASCTVSIGYWQIEQIAAGLFVLWVNVSAFGALSVLKTGVVVTLHIGIGHRTIYIANRCRWNILRCLQPPAFGTYSNQVTWVP